MKPMVLCLSRLALAKQNIPMDGHGLFDMSLKDIPVDDFHFINRSVVDVKDDDAYQMIGYLLPQVLPYITITDGRGKYLSYSRNGTETRLHGSRSIGVGGHVDLPSLRLSRDGHPDIVELIYQSTDRELQEEASIPSYQHYQIKQVIVDTTNSVGNVHLGFFTMLTYPNAVPQDELHDPKWVTLDELKSDIDQYENWSKIIINQMS